MRLEVFCFYFDRILNLGNGVLKRGKQNKKKYEWYIPIVGALSACYFFFCLTSSGYHGARKTCLQFTAY